MQLNDLVHEWLQKAKLDLDSAKFLSDMRPLPKDIIGFHCQQAVEKCLKAFLVLHDIEPPRSHDLLYLKTKCQAMEGLPEIDDTILSRLNPYAVEHRYPGEIDLVESEVCSDLETAGLLVEELLKHIENLMK
ncbi:MAG: HEPN domain-containing protein [Spirochaetia bacterium]